MFERTKELGAQIFRNAQEQGLLRDDITPEDIVFVIWSQAGIIQTTRTVAPTAWRRHLHLCSTPSTPSTSTSCPSIRCPQQVERTPTTLECPEKA
ncbi:hypothetical protein ACWDA7_38085 [Streptomyces sp. NPDC001156]